MKFSVIIATYNRSEELARTLESLAHVATADPWETIVVDNNSSDATRQVVMDAAARFPVPLRYVFEREQGKAAALNTAIRQASGEVLVFTDDDAFAEPDWLDRAGAALEETGAAYVGGRVLPRWESPRPDWLPDGSGRHWAVLASLDFGPERRELGQGIGWPLGVNLAIRADAFHVHGLWWDNRYDRSGTTLRGSGQREWCLRARAMGLSGFYAPDMVVHHLVPTDRLTKRYFRRWFYWYGISRAVLYAHRGFDMEARGERRSDIANTPHVAGVPRYMYRRAIQHAIGLVRDTIARKPVEAFEHDRWLSFFVGVVGQRWRDRTRPIADGPEREHAPAPAVREPDVKPV